MAHHLLMIVTKSLSPYVLRCPRREVRKQRHSAVYSTLSVRISQAQNAVHLEGVFPDGPISGHRLAEGGRDRITRG